MTVSTTKATTTTAKLTTTTKTTTTTAKPTTTTKTTTTTAKPTTTTKTSAAPPKVIVFGDANCDEHIDMSDVVIVMQFLANPDKYGLNGTEQQHITSDGIANSDCDQNTKGVTLNDALAIQKLLLKIVSMLPIKG